MVLKKGTRFNFLVVLRKSVRARHMLCRCDCGEVRQIYVYNLLNGHTKSCGCLVIKSTKQRFRTHGQSKTRTYRAWANMINRIKTAHYKKLNICVCARWKDFFKFKEDMGDCPPKMTLDRIDTYGDYRLGNCRWITQKEQQSNKTTNVFITFKGETKTITKWAETINVKPNTLLYRIYRGWSIERALTSKQ